MATLVRIAPNTAQWPNFTEVQATKLLSALQNEASIVNKHLGMSVGSFSDQGVDFTYTYSAPMQILEVTIAAVHSIKAKIAGHDAIFGALDDAITKYLAS